jgi:hypothetical protein
MANTKNKTNTKGQGQEQENKAKTLSFGEKLQLCNTFLENLRLDAEIAKKIQALDTLSKKTELTKEEVDKVDKLSKEKKVLEAIRKEYKEKYGNPSYSEVEIDKFALICAWSINPQKGREHKEGETKYYDVSFSGMYKVAGLCKSYTKKYLDKPDTEEKTTAKRELVKALDEFVNKYMPEKSNIQLTPCEDSMVSLTFGKYEKETTTLTQKEYKLPKNCMNEGYKPMKVHFVDTEEKPMVTEITAFCSGKNQWSKSGITKKKIDDYSIIQQIFLTALKYNLDFSTGTTTKVYARHII